MSATEVLLTYGVDEGHWMPDDVHPDYQAQVDEARQRRAADDWEPWHDEDPERFAAERGERVRVAFDYVPGTCPTVKSNGEPCKGSPTASGLCAGHGQKVAKGLLIFARGR